LHDAVATLEPKKEESKNFGQPVGNRPVFSAKIITNPNGNRTKILANNKQKIEPKPDFSSWSG